jgi:hypothetical protein
VQVDDFRDSPAGDLVPISWTDPRTGETLRHWAYVPHPLPERVDLRPGTYKAVSEADRALGAMDARISRTSADTSLLVYSASRTSAYGA